MFRLIGPSDNDPARQYLDRFVQSCHDRANQLAAEEFNAKVGESGGASPRLWEACRDRAHARLLEEIGVRSSRRQ